MADGQCRRRDGGPDFGDDSCRLRRPRKLPIPRTDAGAGHAEVSSCRYKIFDPLPDRTVPVNRYAGISCARKLAVGNLTFTGLLGGSFNPAHGGHRSISLFALDALDLDEIWWLVSPGNPLKAGPRIWRRSRPGWARHAKWHGARRSARARLRRKWARATP